MTRTSFETESRPDQQAGPCPALSVVVPIVDVYAEPSVLFPRVIERLRELDRSFELVAVVDGRRNDLLVSLRALKQKYGDTLNVVVLERSFGEAVALAVGFERARGRIFLTVPAYFQVELERLDEAVRQVESGEADLVVGLRGYRSSSLVVRARSAIFHWLSRLLTSSRFRDVTCGVRAMTAAVAQDLSLYGDLHRFIPIMAFNLGYRVSELEMKQRAEDRKRRLYGPGVYLRRALDLLTIFFLVKFTRRPLRFFGVIGGAFAMLGAGIVGYLGLYRILGLGGIGERPLLLLGVLLLVLGVQSVSFGLLGEIIIFTHARTMNDYKIAEVF